MEKEQQQKIVLAVVLVAIVGALVFFNLDKILPKPVGQPELPPPITRLELKASDRQQLFDNPTYKSLRQYGEVPVVVRDIGNDNPFLFIE